MNGTTIESPSDYGERNISNGTVHATINSPFFGFIDDLYVYHEPFIGASRPNVYIIKV